jgi:hypothetical protein
VRTNHRHQQGEANLEFIAVSIGCSFSMVATCREHARRRQEAIESTSSSHAKLTEYGGSGIVGDQLTSLARWVAPVEGDGQSNREVRQVWHRGNRVPGQGNPHAEGNGGGVQALLWVRGIQTAVLAEMHRGIVRARSRGDNNKLLTDVFRPASLPPAVLGTVQDSALVRGGARSWSGRRSGGDVDASIWSLCSPTTGAA